VFTFHLRCNSFQRLIAVEKKALHRRLLTFPLLRRDLSAPGYHCRVCNERRQLIGGTLAASSGNNSSDYCVVKVGEKNVTHQRNQVAQLGTMPSYMSARSRAKTTQDRPTWVPIALICRVGCPTITWAAEAASSATNYIGRRPGFVRLTIRLWQANYLGSVK
jgi:hypothetical protein